MTAAVNANYPVPLSGALQSRFLPFPVRGVIVHNSTNVVVRFYNDRGEFWDTQPGTPSNVINPPDPLTLIQYGTVNANGVATAGTGQASLELWSNPQPPLSGFPQSATIPVTLQGVPQVTIQGSPQITIAPGQSVTVSGNITIAAATVTLNVADSTVAGLMTGFFANNNAPFAMNNNVVRFFTAPYAMNAFSIEYACVDGFLSIWYTFNGVDTYIIRRVPFYLSANASLPIERVFYAPIPIGAVVKFINEMSLSVGSLTAKW